MSSAILVTGANGFIGSGVVRDLESEGLSVRAMIQKGTDESFLDGTAAERVYADLSDGASLAAILGGVERVIHLAAIALDYGPAQRIYDVNVEGTRRLALAAAETGCKRLVLVSSLSVHRYKGYIDGDEKSPRDAVHPAYALSKIYAEDALWEICEKTGLEGVVVRPGVFPFGPRDHTSLAPMLAAMSKGAFPLVNGGRARTCTSYVENLASGMRLAAQHEKAAGEVFVLADDGAPTWRDLLSRLAKACGYAPRFLPVPAVLADFAGAAVEDLYYAFNIRQVPPVTRYRASVMAADLVFKNDKAKRVLGFAPTIDLDEGIARTAHWFKSQKG